MEYEKLHSLEVEKTILGAMIIDSNSCIQSDRRKSKRR